MVEFLLQIGLTQLFVVLRYSSGGHPGDSAPASMGRHHHVGHNGFETQDAHRRHRLRLERLAWRYRQELLERTQSRFYGGAGGYAGHPRKREVFCLYSQVSIQNKLSYRHFTNYNKKILKETRDNNFFQFLSSGKLYRMSQT